MRLILIALLFLQPGPRGPLAPAETLIEPETLRTIERAAVEGPSVRVINGTDANAGEIALACRKSQCEAVEWAMKKLGPNIAARILPPPTRTIRMVIDDAEPSPGTKAAIMVATPTTGRALVVVRGLWSTADITDEVVEIFARHALRSAEMQAYSDVNQPKWEPNGIPVVAIVPPSDGPIWIAGRPSTSGARNVASSAAS